MTSAVATDAHGSRRIGRALPPSQHRPLSPARSGHGRQHHKEMQVSVLVLKPSEEHLQLGRRRHDPMGPFRRVVPDPLPAHGLRQRSTQHHMSGPGCRPPTAGPAHHHDAAACTASIMAGVTTIRVTPLPLTGVILTCAGYGWWWTGIAYGAGVSSGLVMSIRRTRGLDIDSRLSRLQRRTRYLGSPLAIVLPTSILIAVAALSRFADTTG